MQLNWKRIAALIAFLLGVVGLGFLLYVVFLRPAAPGVTPTPGVNAPTGVLPGAGLNANIPIGGLPGAGLPGAANLNAAPGAPTETPSATATGGRTQTTALTQQIVSGATLGRNGSDVQYYNAADGKFYRLTPDGRAVALTDKTFFQVETITWSPDRDRAVLEYPDGANVVYNFATKQQVSLPRHWTDFGFSPNGTQLVLKSLGDTDDARWLVVSNVDGSQAQQIEHIGSFDATVYPEWSPNNQVVAMYTKDAGYNRQNLFFIGRNNENFPLTFVEGRDFRPLWSPKGDQLVYSVYSPTNNNKPQLWVVDAQGDAIGENRRNLGLETWADRCSFTSNSAVYCAVPRGLPDNAGLFQGDLDTMPSDIYKIDLQTGYKTLVGRPQTDHNIASVSVSGDGKYLYFVSQDDGKLYQMRLK